ncbi:Thermolysin metallopeptidase, catalytic domain [Streptomyces sp. DvalAA-14]|uniref:M4 family metallopeptidase n=1 Tax=unclassified Streptomyces TaxID=2593676 RepID=UPI00081B91D8|nr:MULTISPECIES: M4 family metallopeptidase [unclassified Streptomyces]MYS22209.1 peptidase M4 family protein [Streptomyces sp. SID4948]SCE11271.1 Thermolysin metallopeptidase, catalytic domain [Streptomyces sp. DvalAA-14]
MGVFCTIVPPHILDKLAQARDADLADTARRTLEHDARERTRRRLTTVIGATGPATLAPGDGPAEPPADQPRRTIDDAKHKDTLPGRKVRAEGDKPSKDDSVNRAYDGLGATFETYLTAYSRHSIDGQGLPLVASVHYLRDYNNAFWNGEQMVFGDGDGQIFLDFTIPVDVIGHELTHGVTQYSANLDYFGQSGALNESVSDVFGSLIKQYALGQSAEQADWLIGAGLLAPGVNGQALRSMKAPGTAYDDPRLGKDPQPGTMAGYVKGSRDNGGVHINSGIPNHAFYLVAAALGGNAWEQAGLIWYDTLTGGSLSSDAQFADFAAVTLAAAKARYGEDTQYHAVLDAWNAVGVTPAPAAELPRQQPSSQPQEA